MRIIRLLISKEEPISVLQVEQFLEERFEEEETVNEVPLRRGRLPLFEMISSNFAPREEEMKAMSLREIKIHNVEKYLVKLNYFMRRALRSQIAIFQIALSVLRRYIEQFSSGVASMSKKGKFLFTISHCAISTTGDCDLKSVWIEGNFKEEKQLLKLLFKEVVPHLNCIKRVKQSFLTNFRLIFLIIRSTSDLHTWRTTTFLSVKSS